MLSRNDVKPVSLVLLLVIALVSGCGLGKPNPLLEGPPAPAQVGGVIPLTPVKEPVDLASFQVDPCGTLKRENIAALIVDPPDEVSPRRADSAPTGCSWNVLGGPLLSVRLPAGKEVTLAEIAALNERDPSLYPGWRELSISGLPGAQYHSSGDMKSCELMVGMSDEAALEFRYQVTGGAKSQYWGEDRCAAALKAAELVIGNLRGR